MPQTRQLAAIMFTDIVGYTALMGKDEDQAFALLDANRRLQKPLIEKHAGTWLKELGDGVLAQFNSAYDAVQCAREIQKGAADSLNAQLRIGIHVGDIVNDLDDVFGDGVNLASRVQTVADPGGIYITDSVENAIRNRPDIQAVYLGEATLKNVEYPVKLYALQGDRLPVPSFKEKKKRKVRAGRIKSLVVLPFVNLTGKKDQEYIIEGVHDALITEVSHIHSLRVISRTSAMRYANSQVPITDIARELDVDAVVESSILGANGNVRLNVQLIRASPREDHIWAGFFDNNMSDIFSMVRDVTQEIARNIKIVLSPREKKMLAQKKAVDADLYKQYLKGKYYLNQYTPEGFQEGIRHLNAVIATDPTYALAYAGLSIGYGDLAHLPSAPQDAFPRAKQLATQALALDDSLAEAHTALAECSLYHDWDFHQAERSFKAALTIDPNFAPAVTNYGWYLDLVGKKDEAEPYLRKAADLDPFAPIYRSWLAWWYWLEKRYAEGIAEAKRVLELNPGFPIANMVLGSMYAETGRFDEGIELTKKASESFPGLEYALGIALIKAGKKEEAIRLLDSMDKTPFNAFSLVLIYDELGDMDNALHWLQVVYDIRHIFTPWIASGLIGKSFFEDPRARQILKSIQDNLPSQS